MIIIIFLIIVVISISIYFIANSNDCESQLKNIGDCVSTNNRNCGEGKQKKVYNILKMGSGFGKQCMLKDKEVIYKKCNLGPCSDNDPQSTTTTNETSINENSRLRPGNKKESDVPENTDVDCKGKFIKKDLCESLNNKGCGSGKQNFIYKIEKNKENNGKDCPHNDGYEKIENCELEVCPEDCIGELTAIDTCKSQTGLNCGKGYQKFKYNIVKQKEGSGKECNMENDQEIVRECNLGKCPIDCYGVFENEGTCTSENNCGTGIQKKIFKIKTPKNEVGKDCKFNNEIVNEGDIKEFSCSLSECPINCEGEKIYKKCVPNQGKCGPGKKQYIFKITKNRKNGGSQCEYSDNQIINTEETCRLDDCVNCLGGFTDYGTCKNKSTKSVDVCKRPGSEYDKSRRYEVHRPKEDGGNDCDHAENYLETIDCSNEINDCVDCQGYVNWSTCDKDCKGGNKSGMYVVTQEAGPGGNPCIYNGIEYNNGDIVPDEPCNDDIPCPVNCEGEWLEYSGCYKDEQSTKGCANNYLKKRSYNVTIPSANNGEMCKNDDNTLVLNNGDSESECCASPTPEPINCKGSWGEEVCELNTGTCGAGRNKKTYSIINLGFDGMKCKDNDLEGPIPPLNVSGQLKCTENYKEEECQALGATIKKDRKLPKGCSQKNSIFYFNKDYYLRSKISVDTDGKLVYLTDGSIKNDYSDLKLQNNTSEKEICINEGLRQKNDESTPYTISDFPVNRVVDSSSKPPGCTTYYSGSGKQSFQYNVGNSNIACSDTHKCIIKGLVCNKFSKEECYKLNDYNGNINSNSISEGCYYDNQNNKIVWNSGKAIDTVTANDFTEVCKNEVDNDNSIRCKRNVSGNELSDGDVKYTGNCNIPCPINCIGSWVNEGTCSKSCGTGKQKQVYKITQNSENGGTKCYDNGIKMDGDEEKFLDCNTNECSIDCNYSVSDWSSCTNSEMCGSGTKTKEYTITQELNHGGDKCLKKDSKYVIKTTGKPTVTVTKNECRDASPNGILQNLIDVANQPYGCIRYSTLANSNFWNNNENAKNSSCSNDNKCIEKEKNMVILDADNYSDYIYYINNDDKIPDNAISQEQCKYLAKFDGYSWGGLVNDSPIGCVYKDKTYYYRENGGSIKCNRGNGYQCVEKKNNPNGFTIIPSEDNLKFTETTSCDTGIECPVDCQGYYIFDNKGEKGSNMPDSHISVKSFCGIGEGWKSTKTFYISQNKIGTGDSCIDTNQNETRFFSNLGTCNDVNISNNYSFFDSTIIFMIQSLSKVENKNIKLVFGNNFKVKEYEFWTLSDNPYTNYNDKSKFKEWTKTKESVLSSQDSNELTINNINLLKDQWVLFKLKVKNGLNKTLNIEIDTDTYTKTLPIYDEESVVVNSGSLITSTSNHGTDSSSEIVVDLKLKNHIWNNNFNGLIQILIEDQLFKFDTSTKIIINSNYYKKNNSDIRGIESELNCTTTDKLLNLILKDENILLPSSGISDKDLKLKFKIINPSDFGNKKLKLKIIFKIKNSGTSVYDLGIGSVKLEKEFDIIEDLNFISDSTIDIVDEYRRLKNLKPGKTSDLQKDGKPRLVISNIYGGNPYLPRNTMTWNDIETYNKNNVLYCGSNVETNNLNFNSTLSPAQQFGLNNNLVKKIINFEGIYSGGIGQTCNRCPNNISICKKTGDKFQKIYKDSSSCTNFENRCILIGGQTSEVKIKLDTIKKFRDKFISGSDSYQLEIELDVDQTGWYSNNKNFNDSKVQFSKLRFIDCPDRTSGKNCTENDNSNKVLLGYSENNYESPSAQEILEGKNKIIVNLNDQISNINTNNSIYLKFNVLNGGFMINTNPIQTSSQNSTYEYEDQFELIFKLKIKKNDVIIGDSIIKKWIYYTGYRGQGSW